MNCLQEHIDFLDPLLQRRFNGLSPAAVSQVAFATRAGHGIFPASLPLHNRWQRQKANGDYQLFPPPVRFCPPFLAAKLWNNFAVFLSVASVNRGYGPSGDVPIPCRDRCEKGLHSVVRTSVVLDIDHAEVFE